ncbi:MAG TPA: NAD(P)/FAD-dependent oxidoreductase [Candidatus Acidoferrales bacterium]|nr:NAD(P)/FAD-dependent oxidoreductase [Candidatus Acidoferrales bacterium]
MDQANIVIIGGGVIGCAIARAVSKKYSDVFVLESLPKLGMLTSTRNSGVIHSGIYYTQGSLKAKLCVRGNVLTYEFCKAHGVPFRNCGKIVVAPSEDGHGLETLKKNGEANGVQGLRIIDRAAFRKREPHVEGHAALEVPSTGILSSEDLVKAYARLATDQGAHIVTNAKVEKLEPTAAGVRVESSAGEIEARCLINSAGLYADEIAAMLGSKMAAHKIYPVRGEYCEFVRARQDWVRGLVYPMPHPKGLSLGLHLTKTLHGTVLLGPTARYVDDKNNYEKNRDSVEKFVEGAKGLLPEVTKEDLVLAYSGIRPKLTAPGTATGGHDSKSAPDFIIQRDPDFPRVIQLIGMESPGLTSAGAIGEYVSGMTDEILA